MESLAPAVNRPLLGSADRIGHWDRSTACSRRDLLRLAMGLGVSFAVPGMDLRAADQRGPRRPKSLITLWLSGGPSQLETWDPHPGTKIGGPTQAIGTSIPDVQIAADFPRLAEQLRHLAVIRSLVSKEGDHERGTYVVKTGYRPDPTVIHPALGAIATAEIPDSRVEIPLFVSVGSEGFPARGGYLGDQFDPYHISSPGQSGQNIEAPVDARRQQRRIDGLSVVGEAFAAGRRQRVAQTLHQHTLDAALTMMRSEQLRAFRIQEEPAAVRASYGDHAFGQGCLLARRLVEQGVRAIEVGLGGFDTHADNFTGHTLRAQKIDTALSALLRELAERDLLASTVVLVAGEFGRTPKINPLDGRDHWPTGFSCLVGGGGLRGNQVIGATDPSGEKTEPSDPIKVADLSATILAALGIDPAKELLTPIGRPLKLSEGTPIERLWSRSTS